MIRRSGFSLIEVLILIAILGILATIVLVGVQRARLSAYDSSIRTDVGQLRWLTEQMYDTNRASYENWRSSATPVIEGQIGILLNDIEKQMGTLHGQIYPDDYPGEYGTVIRESQSKEYCISAPLRSEPGKFYCIDATAVFRIVSSECPDVTGETPPLRCPSS
ncbi:MAG: prepilin-type N-terminal cleavage/methylation domain-containing protein [Candidatus Andersenbacteria bacterium]